MWKTLNNLANNDNNYKIIHQKTDEYTSQNIVGPKNFFNINYLSWNDRQ